MLVQGEAQVVACSDVIVCPASVRAVLVDLLPGRVFFVPFVSNIPVAIT